MKMTANVNQHGTDTHVGFINNDHFCVRKNCVRTVDKTIFLYLGTF